MTDFEREERAFRAAFRAQSAESPPRVRQPILRHRRWLPAALVAAAVLAVIAGTSVVLRDDGPTEPEPVGASSYWERHEGRWVSFRDLEVLAPAGWKDNYEPALPGCIQTKPLVPDDTWAVDVPKAPYVAVGIPDRPVLTIGCGRTAEPDDPDPAFGEVPFELWQPYVKAVEARSDLGDPEYSDTKREYRGWRLTRETTSGVQITVLSAPGDDDLGAAVLSSARTVETTALGCEVDSPVIAPGFPTPDSPPLPAANAVEAVTICSYARGSTRPGFEASRQITGVAARELVRAIKGAPLGGGPDEPANCLHDTSADRVLVLLALTDSQQGKPAAEAYVYSDSCFGNGIVDAAGKHELTAANCKPLFAEPPIGFWAGNGSVFARCGSL